MRRQDQLLSVIVPLHNHADILPGFLEELRKTVGAEYEQFEVLLIDDGSADDTARVARRFLEMHPGFRYIRLSRRFGTEIAVTAGLESAIGDYCVVLMPDKDPVALIPRFVSACETTGKIVLGERKNPQAGSLAFRLGRRLFHFICERVLGLSIAKNTTFFFCLSRSAVYQINRTKDKHRFLKAITSHIGLPYVTIPYEFNGEPAVPLRSFWESVNLSIDIIVLNSSRPLRLVTFGALLIGFLNLAYIGYIVLIYLLKAHVAEGWVTLSAQQSVSFFLLFTVLAVLSEYVGRILHESKDRPLYYVIEESASRVKIANAHRTNVLSESAIPVRSELNET